MTLDLTPEQSHALQSGQPVRLNDPLSNAVFVLVPEHAYLRVQSLLEDGPPSTVERQAILQGVWQRAEWDDPIWDEYARMIPRGRRETGRRRADRRGVQ
jgi:hypothetical protein